MNAFVAVVIAVCGLLAVPAAGAKERLDGGAPPAAGRGGAAVLLSPPT